LRAASSAMEMFSLTRFWPMYSARVLGRDAGVEACVVLVWRAGDNALQLAVLHHAFCARVGHRFLYFLQRAEMGLNMFNPTCLRG